MLSREKKNEQNEKLLTNSEVTTKRVKKIYQDKIDKN